MALMFFCFFLLNLKENARECPSIVFVFVSLSTPTHIPQESNGPEAMLDVDCRVIHFVYPMVH